MGFCGNGLCEAGENAMSCPKDCGFVVCGNGLCEAGESSATCPVDCGLNGCGDGKCTGVEAFYCSKDCGTTCGNFMCDLTDLFLCPAECGVGGGIPLPLGAPGSGMPVQPQ